MNKTASGWVIGTMACFATTTGSAQATGPELTVTASQDRHAISPDIYGINLYQADPALFDAVAIPVQRFGGNATSRYNWLVDSSNAGHDLFYSGGSGLNPSQVVPGKTVDDMVGFDKAHGAKSIVTLSNLGLVNKFSQQNCSYWETDYPAYGPQWGQFPFWPWGHDAISDPGVTHDCGSGIDPDNRNEQLLALHPLANHIQVDSSWMEAWMRHLVQTNGDALAGGVTIYQMDNEPESWNVVHHDVHPNLAGFDEVVNATTKYAAAVKNVDRSARVLGPSNWGVSAYWDWGPNPGDDQAAHGKAWYEYYLSSLKAASDAQGVRLLDYFDEHFYPQTDGVAIANAEAGDAATQAARLRSTRALWDPTYLQENWMGTYFQDSYGKAMVVPRLRDWTEQFYPGTKTSLTEYNFGGLEHINGALAQADVLGIFGREGLDLATLWEPPKADQPGAFTFRMYLNYDGAGSRYGDVWLESSSSDQAQLAVYASERTRDGALTLIVVNKTDATLTSDVTVKGYAPSHKSAKVYQYSAADLTKIVQLPAASLQKVDHAPHDYRIRYTFPATSITMLELRGQLAPGAHEHPGSGRPGCGLQHGHGRDLQTPKLTAALELLSKEARALLWKYRKHDGAH